MKYCSYFFLCVYVIQMNQMLKIKNLISIKKAIRISLKYLHYSTYYTIEFLFWLQPILACPIKDFYFLRPYVSYTYQFYPIYRQLKVVAWNCLIKVLMQQARNILPLTRISRFIAYVLSVQFASRNLWQKIWDGLLYHTGLN